MNDTTKTPAPVAVETETTTPSTEEGGLILGWTGNPDFGRALGWTGHAAPVVPKEGGESE